MCVTDRDSDTERQNIAQIKMEPKISDIYIYIYIEDPEDVCHRQMQRKLKAPSRENGYTSGSSYCMVIS